MKEKLKMYRQGDVLIREVKAIPKTAKPSKENAARVVFQHGEVTGHAHAIYNPTGVVEGFTIGAEKAGMESVTDALAAGRKAFVKINEATALKHEEHGAINLDPGTYEVFRQSEYSPEALRFVQD
jgi:hypothetical protein